MELTWADKIELKGVERGLEEGIQKGIQKGICQVVLKLASQRFGPPTESIRQQIESIDSTARPNELVEKVLAAASWADLGFE